MLFKRGLENESGQALVMVALCMMTLMGFVGLALDVGLLYHTKQDAQIAADAAATAAATDYLFNASTTTAVAAGKAAAAANGFTNGTNGITVTVNMPPSGGPVTSAGYAEAIVSDPAPTDFMSMFGFRKVTVSARSVAGTPTIGNTCIWLMATSGTGFDMQGSYDVESPTCGVYVNSASSNAVNVGGNGGTMNTKFLDVVGSSVGHQTNPTPITTNTAPRTNPWGNLQGPNPASACTSTFPTHGNASVTVTGTNYATYSGSATNNVVCFTSAVTLGANSGDSLTLAGASSGVVYVFESGVTVTTGATVTFGSCSTCNLTASPATFGATTGATMDLYGGTLTQDSNSILNIYAPTGSTYNGIAILQPTSNTTNTSENNPLQVQFGSNNQVLDGYIYAPGSAIFLQDNGGGITVTGLVANVIKLKSSSITIPADYDQANLSTTPNRQITLVQ